MDVMGAVIPGTKVTVYPKGLHDAKDAIAIESDAAGNFNAPVKNGKYEAVFQVSGFQEQIVGFEVAQMASNQDLQVEMRVQMQVANCGGVMVTGTKSGPRGPQLGRVRDDNVFFGGSGKRKAGPLTHKKRGFGMTVFFVAWVLDG